MLPLGAPVSPNTVSSCCIISSGSMAAGTVTSTHSFHFGGWCGRMLAAGIRKLDLRRTIVQTSCCGGADMVDTGSIDLSCHL